RALPVLRQQAELITDHIAASLHNAQTYRGIFLLWLWRALGRMFGWFRGRNSWIALAVLLRLSAIGAALAYVPWAYRVEGQGKAMPVEQREIFAPWDGDVVEVLVQSNQLVEAGQPLVQLKSDDLQTQLTEAMQERDVYLEQAQSYRIQERQAAEAR